MTGLRMRKILVLLNLDGGILVLEINALSNCSTVRMGTLRLQQKALIRDADWVAPNVQSDSTQKEKTDNLNSDK